MADSAPLTTQDRLDLAELAARYARALDTHDAKAYAANFAPDGSFGASNDEPVRGREAIRALIERLTPTWPVPIRHLAGKPIVEGNGERASMSSYSMVMMELPTGAEISSVVLYTDECVKIDGKWLFQRRSNETVLGRSVNQAVRLYEDSK